MQTESGEHNIINKRICGQTLNTIGELPKTVLRVCLRTTPKLREYVSVFLKFQHFGDGI